MRELPGAHRASADVTDLTALYEIVKGLHGFLCGSFGVKAVNLQQINVWRVQTLQGGIHRVEDGRARQAKLIDELTFFLEFGFQSRSNADIRMDEAETLAGYDDLMTGDIVLLLCQSEIIDNIETDQTFSMNFAMIFSDSPLE